MSRTWSGIANLGILAHFCYKRFPSLLVIFLFIGKSLPALLQRDGVDTSSANVHPCTFADGEGLSKNFSFWTVSLDLDAMFKIKSLLYKDLILNSRGCRKSNQLLRHPHRCCMELPPSVAVLKCTSMCPFSLTVKPAWNAKGIKGIAY